jgi:hypothetical protein
MERWERVVDGAKDVWELTKAGALVTERAGREGAAPVTREHRCDTEATAECIRRRMVAQRERQGYARVQGDAAEGAPVERARPTYPGLTDAKLGSVILRVGKAAAGDAYKVSDAIYKVTGDYAGRYGIAWFLLAHGLVAAETMPGLWDLLAEDHAHVDPAAVLSLLSRLPTGKAFTALFKHGPMTWFVAGFTRSLDELLFAAYQRDPALCDARAAELVEPAQRSLDFVRGRSGVAVPAARAQSLLLEFAHAQATSGLASNWELARVEDGAVVRPRLSDAAAVRAVALRFGTDEAWGAAMVAAALRVPRPSFSNIRDALGRCTAVELGTLLARHGSFGSNPGLAQELRLIEQERDDDPAALLAAAESLRDGDHHAREVSEMLAVVAAARFADRGLPVPATLAPLLRFAFLSGVYHESIRPYVRGLRALPRETVHAMVERSLGEEHGYAKALGALLAWPDAALLARFFDRDAANVYLDPEVVGRFGAAALPELARVWELTPRERRRTRHQQVLAALATAGDRGEVVDPAWDRFVVFDEEGIERLKYWDPSYARVRERALMALPMDRRTAALRRCAEERAYPERPLASARVLDDDGLAAVMAAFLARRASSDRGATLSALQALGDRAAEALRRGRQAFEGDADFAALLRQALPAGQADALLAG